MIRIAAVAIMLMAISGAYDILAAPDGGCLPYGPTKVEIMGRLERRTFPGPPNFESVDSGDRPETGFYLSLATPFCTVGDENDPSTTPQDDVQLVQIVLNDQGYALLSPKLGQVVRIRGRLFSAHTGHHHAPVLLEFEDMMVP